MDFCVVMHLRASARAHKLTHTNTHDSQCANSRWPDALVGRGQFAREKPPARDYSPRSFIWVVAMDNFKLFLVCHWKPSLRTFAFCFPFPFYFAQFSHVNLDFISSGPALTRPLGRWGSVSCGIQVSSLGKLTAVCVCVCFFFTLCASALHPTQRLCESLLCNVHFHGNLQQRVMRTIITRLSFSVYLNVNQWDNKRHFNSHWPSILLFAWLACFVGSLIILEKRKRETNEPANQRGRARNERASRRKQQNLRQ